MPSNMLPDLSDVEFVSRQYAPVVRVTLHDHRSLGGPMGTEHTSVIKSWAFESLEKAAGFAKLLIERLDHRGYDSTDQAHETLTERFRQSVVKGGTNAYGLIDMLSHGLELRAAQEEVITGFSFEQTVTSKQRVSA